MNKKVIFLLLLLLPACQPYMTYDELEEGAKTDPEIQKRLERFERDVERAGDFMEQRWVCAVDGKCYTYCAWHGIKSADSARTKFKDLDELVRWYRKIKHACRFVTHENW